MERRCLARLAETGMEWASPALRPTRSSPRRRFRYRLLAIRQAADPLAPGDIILLELHRAGRPNPPDPPANGLHRHRVVARRLRRHPLRDRQGRHRRRGGRQRRADLDAPIYDVRPAGFPAAWKNPFNRANPTSGAILVGAGAPPRGRMAATGAHDRSRLDFSNWGPAVDAQGWGREVTTPGYGDLQGGPRTCGTPTSSAAPRAPHRSSSGRTCPACRAYSGRAAACPCSPARARELLPGDRLAAAGCARPSDDGAYRQSPRPARAHRRGQTEAVGPWVGVQFTGTVPAELTQPAGSRSTGRRTGTSTWTVMPIKPATGRAPARADRDRSSGRPTVTPPTG